MDGSDLAAAELPPSLPSLPMLPTSEPAALPSPPPPEPITLPTLPDELLVHMLSLSNVTSTRQLAGCARLFSGLVASEVVWRAHCLRAWPQLVQAAAAWSRLPPGSTQRATDSRVVPPPDGWRRMFRERAHETPGWQVLCPLYDSAIVLAHEQEPPRAWVGKLGLILASIDTSRVKLGLPSRRPAFQCDAEYCRCICSVIALLTLEAAQTADAINAYGEDAQVRLDEWYDLAEAGQPCQEHPLLLSSFGAMSELLLLQDATYLAEIRGWDEQLSPLPEFGCVRRSDVNDVADALGAAIGRLERSVKSLQAEGCDLSISAARRPGMISTQRRHWWWRMQEPCFVSGGCPLIASSPPGISG